MSGTRPTPRYAAVFRTHFWDEFAARQLERLRARTNGDVFVLVDETNGAVEGITHDRVLRVTAEGLTKLGLAPRGEQNLLWFNGDYPLYAFLLAYPDYEYYVQLEYDVVLNEPLDAIVASAAADSADFVGLTKGEPVDEWAWRHTCVDAYRGGDIRYQLICFCLVSRRALGMLFERRLALSQTLSHEQAWPFCEGFIATEVRLAGMRVRELSDYCDTNSYDTWPPYIETDLPGLRAAPIVHPVLDEARYVASLLKYKVGLAGYANPISLFHRKLRRMSPRSYMNVLARTFMVKARRTLRQRVAAAVSRR